MDVIVKLIFADLHSTKPKIVVRLTNYATVLLIFPIVAEK